MAQKKGGSDVSKKAVAAAALARSSLASLNVLFQRPSPGGGLEVPAYERREFVLCVISLLSSMLRDLERFVSDGSFSAPGFAAGSREADSADFLNEAVRLCSGNTLSRMLEFAAADSLSARGVFTDSADLRRALENQEMSFCVSHALSLMDSAPAAVRGWLDLPGVLPEGGGLGRVNPAVFGLLPSSFKTPSARGRPTCADLEGMRTAAEMSDPFKEGRAFRHVEGKFFPASLSSIRPVDKFYGYREARNYFRRFFDDFSRGAASVPLLISSLPGLGKTHFTVSHALDRENLVLILPSPSDLEGPLEPLIRRLSLRGNRRFVLFFDDINVDSIDWYYYRTNVGGIFALPPNVTIVAASNSRFPASISSRGSGFEFPMFDEIRCQEMIFDYLVSKGMRRPSADLVSVMAADYVEEFGQRMFEELSPRTLVRYLDKYEGDSRKRRRMVELSRQDVILKPDPQMFFDFNLAIMRAIYGESGVDEMRRKSLGGK